MQCNVMLLYDLVCFVMCVCVCVYVYLYVYVHVYVCMPM